LLALRDRGAISGEMACLLDDELAKAIIFAPTGMRVAFAVALIIGLVESRPQRRRDPPRDASSRHRTCCPLSPASELAPTGYDAGRQISLRSWVPTSPPSMNHRLNAREVCALQHRPVQGTYGWRLGKTLSPVRSALCRSPCPQLLSASRKRPPQK
jgi:hypothetical protein